MLEGLPELPLVGPLVARSAGDLNHGKKSRKFNQDCTICYLAVGGLSDSAVLKQPECSAERREYGWI